MPRWGTGFRPRIECYRWVGSVLRPASRPAAFKLRLRKSRHRIHTAQWWITAQGAAFDGGSLLGSLLRTQGGEYVDIGSDRRSEAACCLGGVIKDVPNQAARPGVLTPVITNDLHAPPQIQCANFRANEL